MRNIDFAKLAADYWIRQLEEQGADPAAVAGAKRMRAGILNQRKEEHHD